MENKKYIITYFANSKIDNTLKFIEVDGAFIKFTMEKIENREIIKFFHREMNFWIFIDSADIKSISESSAATVSEIEAMYLKAKEKDPEKEMPRIKGWTAPVDISNIKFER